MTFSFRTKVLFALGFVGLICTTFSVFLSVREVHHYGEQQLIDKSKAILSRLHVGAKYVAEMDTLQAKIVETKEKYPDGNLSEEQKEKILKSVPIYAAFQIGLEGAKEENYEFRVFADNPRNKKNTPTEEEQKILSEFKKNPELKIFVSKKLDESAILVSVPSRISESQGCLTCHGHPSTSPWGNGKDILGYQLENMKDGDLKGIMTISSSLAPVNAESNKAALELILYGIIGTLVTMVLCFLLIRKPLSQLDQVSKEVEASSQDLNQASSQLAASSQQLASSSQEQASSVQEVSSSLEEISSMLNTTLKESKDSVEKSRHVSTLVESGSELMSQLREAVLEISKSNERVEDLVKLIEEIGEKTELIDEIVFQTKLLSFNASVEAERAGEHGRGFAVVAQEVGNLAQMSGRSASEIGEIVKRSVKEAQDVSKSNRTKVDQGVLYCQKTADQLNQIMSSAKIILDGAEKILRASEEQTAGVDQINQSIQLINQATQQNASAAEEISASGESLIQQGENLDHVVENLQIIVTGSTGSKDEEVQSSTARSSKKKEKKHKAQVIPLESHDGAKGKKVVMTGSKASGQSNDPWEKL